MKSRLESVADSVLRDKVFRWLSVQDPSVNYNVARNKRFKEHAPQFLHDTHYHHWKDTEDATFLWLYGKAGSGKTVLSASIVEDLQQKALRAKEALVFFYFDFRNEAKQAHSSIIRTIAFQLCDKNKKLWDELLKIFEKCENGCHQPTDASIEGIVLKAIRHYSTVWLVIDALDECSTLQDTLNWLQSLLKTREKPLRLLITSRDEIDIRDRLEQHAPPEELLSIEGEILNAEI